jgi:TolB-like protein
MFSDACPPELYVVADAAEQLARLNVALADRYRVVRELGHGGMATVYLARDLKHDRPVALKVLRPEIAAALGSERFLREVRITARLNHPHILPLLDSGEAAGLLYYVMPYVEGESLRDRLSREKQLALDDALQIAREVADALGYAHSHEVVHRDIKPENILLESGHAVVADFGIARALTAAGGERLTETGIAVGTPAYMSPEQAAGSGDVDGRSDVYSLGCVLYEMLAGHPPFTGATAQEILARHSMDTVPLISAARPALPPTIHQAIHTALAKVPADRFPSALKLARALETGAGAQSGANAGGRSRTGRRVALIAVTVLGIAAVAMVAALLVRGHVGRHTGADSVVVVMPFVNRTGQPSFDPLGAITADWLTQGLTEAAILPVRDTRSALAAVQTLGSEATAAAIGREAGAGWVVEGSYFLNGDSLEFQARLVSAADGTVLRTVGGTAAPRDRPSAGVGELERRVVAAIASLKDKEITNFATSPPQPPTYDSYREYTDGLQSYMRLDYPGAERHFEQAAALDSGFLTAHLWAAQSALWTQSGMTARILGELKPKRQRLNTFDRARFDFVAALYGPGPGLGGTYRAADLQGAYRAALQMADAAPGSVDAQREAALAALRVLRLRESLARLQGLDPRHGLMREWSVYWSALAWTHHLLGEYDAELVASRQGRELFPRFFRLRVEELRALAALGRGDELDSIARADLPAAPGWDLAGHAAYVLAGELLAHGHPEAARRLARYEQEQLVAHPAPDSAGNRGKDRWLGQRAELALFLGDAATATDLAARFRYPEEHGWLRARLLAVQGRRDAARAILEATKRRALRINSSLRGLEIEEAGVLVALGDQDGALEVLGRRVGVPLFISSDQDGHATPELARLWNDPRFQRLIAPRD